jgi:hypothetical protein
MNDNIESEHGEADLMRENIARYFEREADEWLSDPENMHPNSGVLDQHWRYFVWKDFVTPELVKQAIADDAEGVAGMLRRVAEDCRKGDFKKAKLLLAHHAGRLKDEEAKTLLKYIDPDAKPYYPHPDRNGDSVIVGKKYRYYPSADNQGNMPCYYLEGEALELLGSDMVMGEWQTVGSPNPKYWEGAHVDRPKSERSTIPSSALRPVSEDDDQDKKTVITTVFLLTSPLLLSCLLPFLLPVVCPTLVASFETRRRVLSLL